MRRPIPDENAPCGAGRAILPEIGSDCLPNIGRKREIIAITSLSTDQKQTGPPIDIVEFQGDHFARAKSQAG
jgi:hypothetical protein